MKNKVLTIIMDIIFIAIFNVLFFLFGDSNITVVEWLSYGFITVSFLFVIITKYLVKQNKTVSSRTSVYSITFTYFIIELITGVVLLCINNVTFKVAFSIQLVLFGIFLILLIGFIMANDSIEKSIEIQNVENSFIKNSCLELKTIKDSVDDLQTKKEIQNVYELLHASPIKQFDSTKNNENRIKVLINDLKNHCDENNIDDIKKDLKDLKLEIECRNNKMKTH